MVVFLVVVAVAVVVAVVVVVAAAAAVAVIVLEYVDKCGVVGCALQPPSTFYFSWDLGMAMVATALVPVAATDDAVMVEADDVLAVADDDHHDDAGTGNCDY
jgi:hypothetical protein